jgi:hypothetical protein
MPTFSGVGVTFYTDPGQPDPSPFNIPSAVAPTEEPEPLVRVKVLVGVGSGPKNKRPIVPVELFLMRNYSHFLYMLNNFNHQQEDRPPTDPGQIEHLARCKAWADKNPRTGPAAVVQYTRMLYRQ